MTGGYPSAPMPGFDAHGHLDAPAFDADRHRVLAHARAVGVGGTVLCAGDPAHWERVEATARTHGLPWQLGLHPWWAGALDPADQQPWLDALAERELPHGLGEIGLDALRPDTEEAAERQEAALRAQLDLARERDWPITLHGVRRWGRLVEILEADGAPAAGGVAHAWSGSAELVERVVRLGLCCSVGPRALRHDSDKRRSAIRAIPEDRLLLETDCPDAPLGEAERGEPADLLAVAAHVARVRETSPERLLAVTGETARALFRLPGGNR